jgi:hypothetical protein
MAVNLLKLAVGVESYSHLSELQTSRLEQARARGLPAELRHLTRHAPRRADEILAGGSLYWVIKGWIRARQRIVRIDRGVESPDGPKCALVLDPGLVSVEPAPHRPFQGWRYLDARDAPPDLSARSQSSAQMPADMADELRSLGLL